MDGNRRDFLKMVTAGVAAAALPAYAGQQGTRRKTGEKPVVQKVLPRWRGFNLLNMFTMRSRGDWAEDDFRWIRDFGFDFARLPSCYRLWIKDGDDYKIHEPMLEKLDRAIELGSKYALHVSVNFHRGPGYSVNREFTEPHNLWKDAEPLKAFCFHWQMLAKRYKGISKDKLPRGGRRHELGQRAGAGVSWSRDRPEDPGVSADVHKSLQSLVGQRGPIPLP